MSINGRKTPLALNAESQFNVNKGFVINAEAISYQGTWSATSAYSTPTTATYTQGTLSSTTVLDKLTQALPKFYNLVSSKISVVVFRNLISIGRPKDSRSNNDRINCAALGNSRPDTFKTSYAGYGTFESGTMTDSYYNSTSTGANVGLVQSLYPPYKYPLSPNSSYIYNNWSSTSPSPGAPNNVTQTSFTPWQQSYQYFHEYAWLTGWPGEYAYQSKSSGNPQQSVNPVEDHDGYAAAYFPRPDLAPVQPWRARDANLIEYDEYFRHGFICTVARQAYYEFWSTSARRKNQYLEFISAWMLNHQFKLTNNQKISSFENSLTFLKGNYSNINDITTSDISGVSLSFKLFGNDLINLGLSLNLADIHLFGLPSRLLITLQINNALTNAVKLSLLLNNLTTEELQQILIPTYEPTPTQEKQIYDSFKLIAGNDLNDVKIILNIATPGLETLADLLNPKKMFPFSWKTLTVPQYSVTANSSKIYDFIYSGEGVNTRIKNWGEYLNGILSDDLARACGAFMCSMNQIKNIRQMDILTFSQVVSNLEVTNKDLNLVNGTNGTPANYDAMQQALSLYALGSGSSGNFKFSDFLGAMSGQPYVSYYKPALSAILAAQTVELKIIYDKLYQKSLANDWAYVSRGKGYQDPYINPSPVWSSLYAYTLFKTQQTHISGTNWVTGQNDLTGVYIPGSLIAFTNSPTETYTVDFCVYNPITNITVINLTSNLITTVNAGTDLFIFENTYDGYPDGPVQDLIDAANLEILRIQNTNPNAITDLNYWWDKIGTQMFIEQRAIPLSASQPEEVYQNLNRSYIDAFVRNIDAYSAETDYCETASVLEAISDLNDLGGQSVIAMMRELRNEKRLSVAGGGLVSDISDGHSVNQASAVAIVENGSIVAVKVTYGGYNYCDGPPTILVYPQGGVFGGTGSGAKLQAHVDENCSVSSISVLDPGSGYAIAPAIYIAPAPAPLCKVSRDIPVSDALNTVKPVGGAVAPGSFVQQACLVPEELITEAAASLTVNEAIEEVTICNCDCWNQ